VSRGSVGPAIFAILWAATYGAAAIGLRDMSPLAFVALRLGLASLGALALSAALRLPRGALARQWPHLLIAGALLHGLALGAAHVALVTLAATPLALVHAFHPVLTATLGVLLLDEHFSPRQWLGMGLGLVGVLLVFPFAHTEPFVMALVLASLGGLTAGTLYLKRFGSDVPPFVSTAIQLVGGGIAVVIAMALVETPRTSWTPSLLGALGWNTLVMSVGGMGLYSFMIERRQAGTTASAFFLVPGATALMAYFMLGQSLSRLALFGLGLASFGVWLVWRRPKQRV
jgi:drug/metabolite transporter (DMT)-like permease